MQEKGHSYHLEMEIISLRDQFLKFFFMVSWIPYRIGKKEKNNWLIFAHTSY